MCEMAIARTIGDETEAAYRRGDLFEKRRRLMADWAKFSERELAQWVNVVPMKRKKT